MTPDLSLKYFLKIKILGYSNFGIKIASQVRATFFNLKNLCMKNVVIIFTCAITILFSACKKESSNPAGPGNSSTTATIKFDFNSNLPAQYNISYNTDITAMGEEINGQSWTKTVTVSKTSVSRLAKLTVYPPVAWVGTNTQANVNLKITVDGIVKKDSSSILLGLDRSSGISVQTTY